MDDVGNGIFVLPTFAKHILALVHGLRDRLRAGGEVASLQHLRMTKTMKKKKTNAKTNTKTIKKKKTKTNTKTNTGSERFGGLDNIYLTPTAV